ncbi:MAG: DUF2914 domain-containing protein [Methyloprofundus sp.]|nr:DUF2914 domain-containing protein [Methyloprofundus sp.]MDT8424735.1 DUF2914 domain-containing protein [Methyloprofundus sp.]
MKTDKKISIKVKSKTEQRIMEDPLVEIITEWNIKRIFIVLLVFLLLVIILGYYLNSSNQQPALKDIKSPAITTETREIERSVTKPDIVEVIKPLKDGLIKPQATQLKKQVILPQLTKSIAQTRVKPASEQLHPNISRARLARSIKNKEPYGDVELPFLVNSEQAQGLFYFTEINNMQGDTIVHEWLKDSKSIYKRKIKIRGNRWRISTSKLFNNKHIGEWQVRALSQQGKILNKIDFLVVMQ